MHATRRRMLMNGLKLFDLVLMVGSFLLAAYLVLPGSGNVSQTFSEFLSMRIKLINFILFLALTLLWHGVLGSFGLYKSRRMSSWRSDAIDSFNATTLGAFLITMSGILFRISMITVTFVLVFWLTVTAATILHRLLLRGMLVRARRHGHNLRNMLIVGTNQRALQFVKQVESAPEMGYRILGFVDQEWNGLESFKSNGHSLVCDFDGLPHYLRTNIIDEVVISLPVRSLHEHAARIAALCEEQGIITRVLPSIFDLRLARPRAEEFEGASMLTHHTGVPEGWGVVVKRTLDIVISAVALLVLSPILLFVAVLIKVTSPGPVMFKQNRLGLHKRRFAICKFRTMVVDAEKKMEQIKHLNEVSGPVFKITNDPRITPLGKFLRKTSIDELPQLWNVLKGDMSLVGPRPLPVRDYEGFTEDWTRRRFSVRPGVTCLWQIAGRSSIPFEKWMQLDLQYIDEWSVWLDLEILARTIPAVLKGSGAA
jgi:exopolysaccharide biosynthesis polyprenyl glycosylphosphotransferase